MVLSEGRISLHISSEVSALDPQNSVTVEGTTVPGLSVRRADTTAEISTGGTLVMAGMIENQTKQTISGLPGMMEVPILGALFKSRDYQNNQTELVFLVTPYIAHAVAQKDLSRPDDGFADPSDPASVLLGRLNRIYGVGGVPRSVKQLPRQIWIYPRLTRGPGSHPMQTVRTANVERCGIAGFAVRSLMILGCVLLVCGCNTDQQVVAAAPDVPYDYRQRHPITMTEVNHTLQVFVGTSRGELNATQRAEVAQFAYSWHRDATGGVAIDLPVGASNERAAADSVRTIRSILASAGVPPDGIVMRRYQAPGYNIQPIRVSYPKIAAQVGPCGLWPEDMGPSFNRDYFENQPPWNFGCATQRNLAAMVDNPADLVQPRGETPADRTRRTTVMGKYEKGELTRTPYPVTEGQISTTVGSQ